MIKFSGAKKLSIIETALFGEPEPSMAFLQRIIKAEVRNDLELATGYFDINHAPHYSIGHDCTI